MDKATDGDVLGNEGRKALDACVKVQIYGRPDDIRKYSWKQCFDKLSQCFEGPKEWLLFEDALFSKFFMLPDQIDGVIFDIHDALVKCDKMPFVEKYPKPGPGSDEMKKLIDKRRDDIEKEYQDATANPDQERRYSWLAAERRVRDCFAGSFAFDRRLMTSKSPEPPVYYISDIYEAVCIWNEYSLFPWPTKDHKLFDGDPWTLNQTVQQRKDISEELREAEQATDKTKLKFYTHSEASDRVARCYSNGRDLRRSKVNIVPHKTCKDVLRDAIYSISDIHEALQDLDEKKAFQKNPKDDGPGSDELRKLIDESNIGVKRELDEAKHTKEWREYSLVEAEHRVRDCFAGNLPCDTDIFPTKEAENTCSIFDIKKAVDRFDSKKLGDEWSESDLLSKEWKLSSETRAEIKREYDYANKIVEIEHGSGFIVQEHLAITNKHVIDDVLNDSRKELFISNATTGQLSCKVVHYDAGKDLALLYCEELKGISPLQFSCQSLLPGMQILSFGFPMSHTEETALFVSGHVSGSKKTLSGNTLTVMNCPLNCGNSGGPILRWVDGQLKVVGVALQKHFKEILTLEERVIIEEIRELVELFTIDSVPDDAIRLEGEHPCLVLPNRCQIPLHLLTLKLYDALETHSQFNLSNAVPGCSVIEFIKDAIRKCNVKCKAELSKVIQWAQDHANVLPSGQHSAAEC